MNAIQIATVKDRREFYNIFLFLFYTDNWEMGKLNMSRIHQSCYENRD